MTNVVGQSLPRIDVKGKVTGETLYSGDIVMPGMLQMKILFSARPHARILSLDTAAAEALPGVVSVLTAKDVPVNMVCKSTTSRSCADQRPPRVW